MVLKCALDQLVEVFQRLLAIFLSLLPYDQPSAHRSRKKDDQQGGKVNACSKNIFAEAISRGWTGADRPGPSHQQSESRYQKACGENL